MTNNIDDLLYELQNANYTVDVCKTELYVRDYYSGDTRIGTTVKELNFTEYEYLPANEIPSDLSTYCGGYPIEGIQGKPHWLEVWQDDWNEELQNFDLVKPYTEIEGLYQVCYVQVFDSNSNLVSDYLSYKLLHEDTYIEEG